MKKLIFGGFAIAALAVGGFLLSESRTQAYDLTPAQLSNLDALTDGESGFEYQNGNAITFTCGGKYNGSDCQFTVVWCTGGGSGCTPRRCPIHG